MIDIHVALQQGLYLAATTVEIWDTPVLWGLVGLFIGSIWMWWTLTHDEE